MVVLPHVSVFVPQLYSVQNICSYAVFCIVFVQNTAETSRLRSVSAVHLEIRSFAIADLRPLHILGIIGPEPLGFTTFFIRSYRTASAPRRVRDREKICTNLKSHLLCVRGLRDSEKNKLYPASTSLAHLTLALLCCSRRLLTKPPQLASSTLLNHLRRSQIRKMGEITHATIQGMFMFGFASFLLQPADLRVRRPPMIVGRLYDKKKKPLGRPRHLRLASLSTVAQAHPLRRPHRQHAEIS